MITVIIKIYTILIINYKITHLLHGLFCFTAAILRTYLAQENATERELVHTYVHDELRET